jgi:hypothetical protein
MKNANHEVIHIINEVKNGEIGKLTKCPCCNCRLLIYSNPNSEYLRLRCEDRCSEEAIITAVGLKKSDALIVNKSATYGEEPKINSEDAYYYIDLLNEISEDSQMFKDELLSFHTELSDSFMLEFARSILIKYKKMGLRFANFVIYHRIEHEIAQDHRIDYSDDWI